MDLNYYLEYWDCFINYWLRSNKGAFDNDIWSKEHNGKGKFKLEYNYLPQPYLGDPKNCSIITLNLNPGPVSPIRKHPDGFLVRKLKEQNSYFEYAKSFPQTKIPEYPNRFWDKQFAWIQRLLHQESVEKLPFAIEVCQWHSNNWKATDASEEVLSYLNYYVFQIIEKVIPFADVKTVLSVGKTYYDIFNEPKMGFEKVMELSPENHNLPKHISWPKNKKGKPINRFFSLWMYKKTKTLYLNTYSYGSNSPPSKEWNQIQSLLLNSQQSTDNRHQTTDSRQ